MISINSQTAIDSANAATTVIVGDDTDLLIILCYHVPNDISHDIYCIHETKLITTTLPRCWHINLTKQILGDQVCEHILFAHALLGCDTTSRVFGLGKGVALKHLRSGAYLNTQTEVFDSTGATKEDIVAAGENALVSMYGDKHVGMSINQLRLHKFCQKVCSSSSRVQPQTLPPLQRQHATTAFGCTIRCRHGEGILCKLLSGAGEFLIQD